MSLPNNSYSEKININDYGIIAIMYHRFDENKYPSTNIKMIDFKEHLNLIKLEGLNFVNPSNFQSELNLNKKDRKVLITIDDGFLSFYKSAWPILKKEKIPFILFVNTREVGSNGYMTWEQIKEISKEDFVHIGNHSHSHEYLIDFDSKEIISDIKKSIIIFKKELGDNSEFFSYPFGEYSLAFKKIVKDLGFKYAFGQHSGVIDETKDFFELPRFPINEKYGETDRFKIILKTIPFKYKKITPDEKYINNNSNPPKISIEFFNKLSNFNSLNCFSNEDNTWRKTNIELVNDNILKINLVAPFTTERGRVNCSLRENGGYWRWLGLQFVIAEK